MRVAVGIESCRGVRSGEVGLLGENCWVRGWFGGKVVVGGKVRGK